MLFSTVAQGWTDGGGAGGEQAGNEAARQTSRMHISCSLPKNTVTMNYKEKQLVRNSRVMGPKEKVWDGKRRTFYNERDKVSFMEK